MSQREEKIEANCYHCGAPVPPGSSFVKDDKLFCCNGCKAVYEILSGRRLYSYYDLSKHPGKSPAVSKLEKFAFLDDPGTVGRLTDLSDGDEASASFFIPQMHCSSCIWLLENLHDLHGGIKYSRVDFLKKSLKVRFLRSQVTLRQIVELLVSVGYEPELNHDSGSAENKIKRERDFYLRIGVAAFCFGNIMLFSLPEYLSSSTIENQSRYLFGWINLFLSIPVVAFSAMTFIDSALKGLRKKAINIDLPIAAGILILFLRSAADVIFQNGPGFFDSLTGLVFLLLIGRLFQDKTYDTLNFERKYQSYFPLAVSARRSGREVSIPVTLLRPGERIVIRNNEIIPSDSVLISGKGNIDYSFVTGESRLSAKNAGDTIYAGGKHHGSAIELEALREVSEGKFVQMWNEFSQGEKPQSGLITLSNTVGRYFTAGILAIAAVTAVVWWQVDPGKILDAVTAVLIVACPCALALAAPFVFGTTLRILGGKGVYLKNSAIVEILPKMESVVFDKTGTITETKLNSIRYAGDELSEDQKKQIASVVRNSTHPLSRSIFEHLSMNGLPEVAGFEETEGSGVSGISLGQRVRIGSRDFVSDGGEGAAGREENETSAYALIGEKLVGRFVFENVYRAGLGEILTRLEKDYSLHLLSGDSEGERSRLEKIYPGFKNMLFDQSPADKLGFIKGLQAEGKKVMMIGDGLNDAGALLQSEVGVAVAEEVSSFSPSCDIILNASSFGILDKVLRFATTAKHIVYWSFMISFLYNVAGLYFAVRGELSPLLAAVLMPLSSVSVVLFSTLVTRHLAGKKGLG